MTGERESMAVKRGRGGMEPGHYSDGNAERREWSCFRRGALESWKADGFGDGLGRELDGWQCDEWRARTWQYKVIEGGDRVWATFGWKRGETGMELL